MNFKFKECIKDCFFELHMKEPTQGRGINNASLSYLVLTSNNDFIDNVLVKDPLGKSDRSITEGVLQNHPFLSSYTEMWDYSKADFVKMKALFNDEFNTSIKSYTDVESQYAIFDNTLNLAKKDFFKKKEVLNPNLHNHHVKLNGTVRAKVRKK